MTLQLGLDLTYQGRVAVTGCVLMLQLSCKLSHRPKHCCLSPFTVSCIFVVVHLRPCLATQPFVAPAGAEVASKRRHVPLADNSKSDPAGTTGAAGRLSTDAHSTQPPEAAAFANAAHLFTGQTEVLVAPGLEQQHWAQLEQPGQATADNQTDSEASVPAAQHAELTLDLGGDNDADIPLSESCPEASGAPASQDVVNPDLQAAQVPADMSAEVKEQLEGNDAGGSQVDCDMHSIASDGADSYQGLPVDKLDQQAAVTSSSGFATDNGRPLEDASRPFEVNADIHSEADKDQQQPQQQQQLELEGDIAEAAAMENALPQCVPEPTGHIVNEQQHAQTGAHVPAADMNLDNLQAAMSDSPVEAAQTTEQVNDPSSLAGTVEGSQSVAQLGIWVEVCSRPAVGQWSWQLASFQAAALPTSGLVSVTYKAPPSELPFSVKSELVNVDNVRHMAPSDTYVKALSELQRGAAVEVNMGDGRFMCAVLVARTQHLQTALGQQQGGKGSIQGFERALENADKLLPGRSFTQASLWLHMQYNTLLASNMLQLHHEHVCVQVLSPSVLCAHTCSDCAHLCLIQTRAAGF